MEIFSPGLRLVVIEDNDEARETLADALTMCGHQVEVAMDGEEGLALVLASRPDVALLDIGLPKCDGYEVARAIRLQLGMGGPRLVAMTGYGQRTDRDRALEAGFDVHMVKPLSMSALTAVLKELWNPRA